MKNRLEARVLLAGRPSAIITTHRIGEQLRPLLLGGLQISGGEGAYA